MGSSRTRARTCVPCIGRCILNHCATREIPRRGFVSALEELSCDQSVWPQSVIPNRYLKILIFNDNVVNISYPFDSGPPRCTSLSGHIPVGYVGTSIPISEVEADVRGDLWKVTFSLQKVETKSGIQISWLLVKCQHQIAWPECFACKRKELGLGFLDCDPLWMFPLIRSLTSVMGLGCPAYEMERRASTRMPCPRCRLSGAETYKYANRMTHRKGGW